jgi:hypothetical protein
VDLTCVGIFVSHQFRATNNGKSGAFVGQGSTLLVLATWSLERGKKVWKKNFIQSE